MVTSTENISTDEMEQKITAQIEYYFGDQNLKHDKFMKTQMEENDGWLGVDKLMTFNRLKNLTTDTDAVVNCIKKSTTGLVELNEDGTKIRRNRPVPEESEEYIKELNQRTLHLKGFPKDSLLDDIIQFCSQFGKTEFVQMRRNFKKNNEFKGCIMVTFQAKEDADKILNSETPVKYKDTELLKENKEKYFERKKEFYDSLKKKRSQAQSNSGDEVRTKGAILKISGLSKDTKFSDIKEELSKHSKVAFVSNVNDKSECNVRFYNEDGAKEALKALKKQLEKPSEESQEKVAEDKVAKDKAAEDNVAEDKAAEDNVAEDKVAEDKAADDKIATELCNQKVDISLVGGDEEKAFWREFQSKQYNSSNFKKNKWQKGKKRYNKDDGNRRHKFAKTEA